MGVWADLSLFRVDFDSNTRIFTMLVYGLLGGMFMGAMGSY